MTLEEMQEAITNSEDFGPEAAYFKGKLRYTPDPDDETSENHFEQELNDTQPEITLLGSVYLAGTSLRKLDHITFRAAYLEYCDFRTQEGCVWDRDNRDWVEIDTIADKEEEQV